MSGSPGPILGFDFPLDAPNGWHEANRYLLWTGHFPLDAPPVALQERIGTRTETLPLRNRSLSLVPAGTPHRLTHLAGFWRTSDADLIVLRAELPEALVRVLVRFVGTAASYRPAGLVLCCNAALSWRRGATTSAATARFRSGRSSSSRCARLTPALRRRTCPACGAVHPLAYGFDAGEDTGDERLARAAW